MTFCPPQRFVRLCSPAKKASGAHSPTAYSPVLPLTEKQKEPVTDIIQNQVTA